MGAISVEPLASLVTLLAHKYEIGCFVETGTYLGDGAIYAATVFPRVVTIEIKREYQQEAIARAQGSNIEFLLGDSASLLPGVVSGLKGNQLLLAGRTCGGWFFRR
ncbi:MAG: hypothetical protein WCA28_27200 [Bradyrhizobium sp.]